MLKSVISALWGRRAYRKSQWQSPLNVLTYQIYPDCYQHGFIFFFSWKMLYWQTHFPLSAVIRSRNNKCLYLPLFFFSLPVRPECVFYQPFPLHHVLSSASDFFLWPIESFTGSPCQLSLILATKICFVVLSSLCELSPAQSHKNVWCKHRILPVNHTVQGTAV